MKHLILSGYYGFGNAGDEAILCSMLASLSEAAREVGEEVSFTVLSEKPALTEAHYGVQAVGRTDIRRIVGAMLRADVFISGGGGLLQDVTGRSLSVAYYLGLVLLARLLRLPAILYGQGIGPITRPFNRLLVRHLADRATYISVRDEGSRRELIRLGVSRPPLTVTADPAFALAPAFSPKVAAFLGKLAPSAPRIGISVRPWPPAGQINAEIAGAANQLAQELSAQLVLIPMYPDKDLPACRQLATLLKTAPVILEEELTPSELLAVFTGLSLVLAMRLHALVFAAKAGLPMVGIGYDPKVEAMLLRLGQAKPLPPREITARQLTTDVLAQWAGREENGRRLREASALAAAEARRFAREVIELVIVQGGGAKTGLRETFLGIPADVITLPEAVEWARARLADDHAPQFICSVNPEICVAAQTDYRLRRRLQTAELAIPDGIGIVLISRLRGGRIRERVAGADLLLALCALAAKERKSVFFFGAAAGVAESAAAAAAKRCPGLLVAGTQHGYILPEHESEVAARIAASGAALVFVGLGSPRQEYFVDDHGAATGARLLMVVGGAFDVLAGKVRRAPHLYQRLGLEWFYRLVQQPRRLRRILALPRFFVLALIKRNN